MTNLPTISAFSFVHNALESGYPIAEAIRAVESYVDEIVIVDMQSTDGTRDLLKRFGVRILDGEWGNEAGETLRQAHSMYIECKGDVIVHFEADEVYDDTLIRHMIPHARLSDDCHLAVYRLQLEQNFQRCRWYPEPVHRVWPRFSNARKVGHTTDQHDRAFLMTEKNGYLWDITNCFRDNWLNRVRKQAELRGTAPQYLMVPIHALHKAELTEAEAIQWLNAKHWTATNTPFNIPTVLKPLVGMTKYEPWF